MNRLFTARMLVADGRRWQAGATVFENAKDARRTKLPCLIWHSRIVAGAP